ncbi:MAG: lipoate--protein ligase [Bacteroidota bacterium]
MMDSFVYIDNEDRTDPATNLAIEEYVLRHMDPARDYLLLYRNEPSVIVGRNQNVLEEINDAYVREKNIPVLRRISGGGTVYHDPHNLNFSFITRYEPSRLHNFKLFNAPVVRILRSLGVPAEMNERNDILADGRKISGSAQFSSKGRMVSHGTLLFSSRLEDIGQVLTVRMKNIRSRSHKSVRSVVANISDYIDPPMDIKDFREKLLEGLEREGRLDSRCLLSASDWEQIRELHRTRYMTWQWNIGRSPRFHITRSRSINDWNVTMELEVNKGHIRTLSITNESGNGQNTEADPGFEALCRMLTGVRYEPGAIRSAIMRWSEAEEGNLLRKAPYSDAVALLIYGEDG